MNRREDMPVPAPWSAKFFRLLQVLMLFFASIIAAQEAGLGSKLLDIVLEKYGPAARDRLLEWEELIKSNREKSETEKLDLVNHFFNRNTRFVDDIDHWGKEDYWATPVETLATNGGDCEDFSIAKYFTLKEMGAPEEKMLLTYVKAVELDQAHMVLTYYPEPDAEPLVLDNLIDEIKPASQRPDLIPVYSFNGDGLWLSKERGKGARLGGSDRISLWRDLGLRMSEQNAK